MPVIILWVVIVFIVLCAVYTKCLRLDEYIPDKKTTETSLSLYGDSISYAVQLNPTPAQALSKYWTVSNYAIAGMTMNDLITGHTSILQPDIIIQPIGQQFIKDKSKVILVRLGINDSLRHNSKLELEDNIVSIIAFARMNSQIPVICGLTHINEPTGEANRTVFNELIKNNCADTKAHFIDIGSVPFIPSDFYDNLHPTQGYSTRIDEYIISYLQENVFTKFDK